MTDKLNGARDVIVACDFASAEETMVFLGKFGDERPFVKIGMELYYAAGPDIVRQLKARGHRVFLDLKLHDIPNTVKKAMRVLSGLGADIVNLHAAGTRAMMEAALEGLTRPDGSRPLLIAVTQLTSTDQQSMEQELLIPHPIDEVVIAYAKNAAAAGLDGVVCSPLEAGKVHQACGDSHRDTGGAVHRRRQGRPEARHHPGTGERTGKRLYRRRPPHHGSRGSRRRLASLQKGISVSSCPNEKIRHCCSLSKQKTCPENGQVFCCYDVLRTHTRRKENAGVFHGIGRQDEPSFFLLLPSAPVFSLFKFFLSFL